MGSRTRVMAFVNACRHNGFKGTFQFVPCSTDFSFANSQRSQCYERLVITFPTDPPCSTEVDILEEGTVPILISLQQMRNLYMEFRHTPTCDYLTCSAFGLKNFPIPVSTSNHLLLDMCNLKRSPQRVEGSFLDQELLPPDEASHSGQGSTTLEGEQSPRASPGPGSEYVEKANLARDLSRSQGPSRVHRHG